MGWIPLVLNSIPLNSKWTLVNAIISWKSWDRYRFLSYWEITFISFILHFQPLTFVLIRIFLLYFWRRPSESWKHRAFAFKRYTPHSCKHSLHLVDDSTVYFFSERPVRAVCNPLCASPSAQSDITVNASTSWSVRLFCDHVAFGIALLYRACNRSNRVPHSTLTSLSYSLPSAHHLRQWTVYGSVGKWRRPAGQAGPGVDTRDDENILFTRTLLWDYNMSHSTLEVFSTFCAVPV